MAGVGEGTVLAKRYRLDRKLGEGAMGTVWRAEHLSLASPVAIKVLDESIAKHGVALARFMREARAAASLKSVHVVQIHDYGVDEDLGAPYIAMEFLEGETLSERIQRVTRLSPRETALILTHVARGIGRAHETGVIHRDLKPDNIFLLSEDDEEYAKVLDFGVAKAGEGVFAATLTSAGRLLGTPAYMSAEQAAGRSVDHRTDIWAMAVIAFECLTGELPFVGTDLPDLLHAIHDGPLPVPSRHASVPFGFDEWFAQGTARHVNDRFYSAKSMAARLRDICGVEVTSSASASALADAREERRAHPLSDDDALESEETTRTRIANAFRKRAESEPDSLFDDIIRTQDVLDNNLVRCADDVLTEEGLDDESGAKLRRGTSSSRVDYQPEPPLPLSPEPPTPQSPKREWRSHGPPPPKPRRSPTVPPGSPNEDSARPPRWASAPPPSDPLFSTSPPSRPPPSGGRLSDASTTLGTAISVPPLRRSHKGLLVGAAIVVVLGTVAATAFFILGAPPAETAPAVPPPPASSTPPVTSEASGTQPPKRAPRGTQHLSD